MAHLLRDHRLLDNRNALVRYQRFAEFTVIQMIVPVFRDDVLLQLAKLATMTADVAVQLDAALVVVVIVIRPSNDVRSCSITLVVKMLPESGYEVEAFPELQDGHQLIVTGFA